MKNGLKVIYCFGETLEQREAKETMDVIKRQLESIKEVVTDWDNIVLAYEPIWAIGTGKTASKEQVAEVHDWIRKHLSNLCGEKANSVRIIYGGSVNSKNCEELIKVENVDGFLVGGASLKPDFADIVASAKLK
jgi:triosephosphate isomerase (TIM)